MRIVIDRHVLEDGLSRFDFNIDTPFSMTFSDANKQLTLISKLTEFTFPVKAVYGGWPKSFERVHKVDFETLLAICKSINSKDVSLFMPDKKAGWIELTVSLYKPRVPA